MKILIEMCNCVTGNIDEEWSVDIAVKIHNGLPHTESGEGENPDFLNFDWFEWKQARLVELEILKKDEQRPEAVCNEINEIFYLNEIISILRDSVWFTMNEMEGDKQAVYNLSGVIMEDMHRPGRPLHSIPASVRKSILLKSIKSGLIIETNEGYNATELGGQITGKAGRMSCLPRTTNTSSCDWPLFDFICSFHLFRPILCGLVVFDILAFVLVYVVPFLGSTS